MSSPSLAQATKSTETVSGSSASRAAGAHPQRWKCGRSRRHRAAKVNPHPLRPAASPPSNQISYHLDTVLYDPAAASPTFWVDDITGERIITIDAATFGKTEAGQLIAGTHEWVHAEQWAQVLGSTGGNLSLAHQTMFGASDLDYAICEVLTEQRALQNVGSSLTLTPQQVAESTRYIEFWQNQAKLLGGTGIP